MVDRWSSLIIASRYSGTDSNIETVELLINSGADVNATTNGALTALMLASRNYATGSTIETVKILINANADVDMVSSAGDIALTVTDSAEIMQLLIVAGANVNMKYSTRTFLMCLLSKEWNPSYTSIVIDLLHLSQKTLLDTDSRGKTAYDYYVDNHHDCLELYHLNILKGTTRPNRTKSAKN